MDKFVLYENQLIDVKHYPVCMVINSVSEMDFPYLIQCLSEGESYDFQLGIVLMSTIKIKF